MNRLEMIEYKQGLIDELKNSLPSKRMLEVTNNLVVKSLETGELFYLKQRPNFEDIPISEYIHYDQRQDIFHDYGEILAKSVIVDNKLLNRNRSEKAFVELSKMGK